MNAAGVSAFGAALIGKPDADTARTYIGAAPTSHTHSPEAITGSSAAGRAMLTAADVAAQRALLGLARYEDVERYASPDAAATACYQAGLLLSADADVVINLACNPTAGDDLKAMLAWAQLPHLVYPGNLRIKIADGLHELNTFAELSGSVTIIGSDTPDYITATALSIASLGSNQYEATVTVATALPARVVPNYAIGLSEILGDNGADSVNGGHQVYSVAGDRLSFVVRYRSYGVAPTSPTALSGTSTIGMTPNQVMIPKCCLRVQAGTSGGWDGAAIEGFLNVYDGFLTIKNVGISYNGVASEHDIIFARGSRSRVYLERCAIAGAGDKVLRAGMGAEFFVNLTCLGGGLTATEIWQGVGGSLFYAQRVMFGSVSTSILTATANCSVFLTFFVVVGAPSGGVASYADATINFTSGRIAHCNNAANASAGVVAVNASTKIRYCTNPSATGTTGSTVGTPAEENNTNAWQAIRYRRCLPRVQSVVAPGSIAAHSAYEFTVTVTGAAIGDDALVHIAGASSTQTGFIMVAWVSATNTVTVRLVNFTTASISVSARTFNVSVIKQ